MRRAREGARGGTRDRGVAARARQGRHRREVVEGGIDVVGERIGAQAKCLENGRGCLHTTLDGIYEINDVRSRDRKHSIEDVLVGEVGVVARKLLDE